MSYVEHGPITISSNDHFSLLDFPGSGPKDDLYMIERLNITTDFTCIRIDDTTAYCVITGCFLTSVYFGSTTIWMSDAANGGITNNTIDAHDTGIRLHLAINMTVADNYLTGDSVGISTARSSSNTRVSHNTIGSFPTSIEDKDSRNVTADDITINIFCTGVLVQNSHNNTVIDNTLTSLHSHQSASTLMGLQEIGSRATR